MRRRSFVSKKTIVRSVSKKGVLFIFLLAILLVAANASAYLFTAYDSYGRSASADFAVSVNDLIVTLTNTSTADVEIPVFVLTALFFTADVNLTPVSALLADGSTVFFGPDGGGNVGGEWAYGSGLSGAPLGAIQGISSAGFGLFGAANFGGSNLNNPIAVNGLNYGITSAGDSMTTGNAEVTGNVPLINNSVVFTLSGATGYDVTNIKDVSFQYGTSLSDPNIVPIPAAAWLLGSGLIGLVAVRRRYTKK